MAVNYRLSSSALAQVDDDRGETPELHEEALPYEVVVAMTPHGMMSTGPYEAGPRRYEMRSFFKSLRFFGYYHVPCHSPRHGTSRRDLLFSASGRPVHFLSALKALLRRPLGFRPSKKKADLKLAGGAVAKSPFIANAYAADLDMARNGGKLPTVVIGAGAGG